MDFSNNECYICTENYGKPLTCKCKNIYLHDECLLKSIKKLNTINCTICKDDYKNIIYIKKKKFYLEINGKYVIYRVFIILGCILITSTEVIIYFTNYDNIFSNSSSINNKNNLQDDNTVEIAIISICYIFLLVDLVLIIELIHFIFILYRNQIPIYTCRYIIYPKINIYYISNIIIE